jgi:hypothetical protein
MKTSKRVFAQVIAICVATSGLAATAGAQANCPARPNLKIDKHTLDYSEHRPICVNPNGVFRIKLKPQGTFVIDPDKIRVKEKAGPGKIEKKGIDDESLVMRVKVSGYPSGADAEFMIIVDDVGQLDPRVRINNSFLALTIEQELMDDYALDNFGLSLLDLKEIDGYFQQEFDTTITDVTRSLGATTEAE